MLNHVESLCSSSPGLILAENGALMPMRGGGRWRWCLPDRDREIVPNLGFHAVGGDWPAVLETVFILGLSRVFESDSESDRELHRGQNSQKGGAPSSGSSRGSCSGSGVAR